MRPGCSRRAVREGGAEAPAPPTCRRRGSQQFAPRVERHRAKVVTFEVRQVEDVANDVVGRVRIEATLQFTDVGDPGGVGHHDLSVVPARRELHGEKALLARATFCAPGTRRSCASSGRPEAGLLVVKVLVSCGGSTWRSAFARIAGQPRGMGRLFVFEHIASVPHRTDFARGEPEDRASLPGTAGGNHHGLEAIDLATVSRENGRRGPRTDSPAASGRR